MRLKKTETDKKVKKSEQNGGKIQEKVNKLKETQETWKKQHAAEKLFKNKQEETPSNIKNNQSIQNIVQMNPTPQTLIENRREPNSKLQRILASEMAQQTCLLCFEFMYGPHHSPMLLSPCGHTFCDACLQNSFCAGLRPKSKNLCPSCKSNIVSITLNVSLQQLILTGMAKKNCSSPAKLQTYQNIEFQTSNHQTPEMIENKTNQIKEERKKYKTFYQSTKVR
eukprot:Sdes_comp13941_c0_seq1m3343